jgi:hypothetical protein
LSEGYSAPGLTTLTDTKHQGGTVRMEIPGGVQLVAKADKKEQEQGYSVNAQELDVGYQLTHRLNISTRVRKYERDYDGDCEKIEWLKQYFSGKKLSQIDSDLIYNTIEKHKAHVSGATRNRYKALIRAIMRRAAFEWKWIEPGEEYRYKLMLRSFVSVFPYVAIWHDGSLVIGSNDPISLDPQAFERKVQYPHVQELFARVGLGTFEILRTGYLGGREEALAYVGEGPLLRDDRPIIEYFLSMPSTGRNMDSRKLRSSTGIAVHTP